MKETPERQEKRKGLPLLFSIIIIFCIFGAIVFSVSRRLSSEMSQAAIQNLSESLDLLQSTIEAILHNEAEFQKLIAQEIARVEDPEDYIRAFERNQTMAKLSLIPSGSVAHKNMPPRGFVYVTAGGKYRSIASIIACACDWYKALIFAMCSSRSLFFR